MDLEKQVLEYYKSIISDLPSIGIYGSVAE